MRFFLSITSSLLFKQSMKTNQGCCFASPMPEASGEHFHFAVVLEKVVWSGAIALCSCVVLWIHRSFVNELKTQKRRVKVQFVIKDRWRMTLHILFYMQVKMLLGTVAQHLFSGRSFTEISGFGLPWGRAPNQLSSAPLNQLMVKARWFGAWWFGFLGSPPHEKGLGT